MEKKAVAGMRFMPGEMLYQVADLSSVWVIADVFEQDIGLVRVGQQAKVRIGAYPDKAFEGTVTYVYPTLKAETRSVRCGWTGQSRRAAQAGHVRLAGTGGGRWCKSAGGAELGGDRQRRAPRRAGANE
jgi:hypothetical protein